MLGTQLYYEFIDEAPTPLQRSLKQLRKELDGRGVPRIGDRSSTLASVPASAGLGPSSGKRPSATLPVATAELVIVAEKGLESMGVEEVAGWCQQRGLVDMVAVARQHSLSGKALHHLLQCSDAHTLVFVTTLARALGVESLGTVLEFLRELSESFVQ